MHIRKRSLFASLITLVAASGLALAQNPLSGTFVEPTIGFVVELNADAGQLSGALHGQAGPMPLTLSPGADPSTVIGWFMLQNVPTGFMASLAGDGNTLNVSLFQLDQAGNAVPGSEEAYFAVRQYVDPALLRPAGAQPPVQQPPVMPVPQPPVAQTPEVQAPPPEGQRAPPPPRDAQPPAETVEPPAIGDPAAVPPVIGEPVSPQPPSTVAGPLTGSWAGMFQLQGYEFELRATFNPDGTYLQELYQAGNQVTWSSGVWKLDADGSLQLSPSQQAEQFCLAGECVPNDPLEDELNLVQFSGPDTMTLSAEVGEGQPPLTITLQRTDQ